jgi:hypothetical protein
VARRYIGVFGGIIATDVSNVISADRHGRPGQCGRWADVVSGVGGWADVVGGPAPPLGRCSGLLGRCGGPGRRDRWAGVERGRRLLGDVAESAVDYLGADSRLEGG